MFRKGKDKLVRHITLEEELISCFKKRNITVEKLKVHVDKYNNGLYTIEVKYPKSHILNLKKDETGY